MLDFADLPWKTLRRSGRPATTPLERWISLFPSAPMLGVRWHWADWIPEQGWLAQLETPTGVLGFGWWRRSTPAPSPAAEPRPVETAATVIDSKTIEVKAEEVKAEDA